jgi:hypothetical protein
VGAIKERKKEEKSKTGEGAKMG